MNKIIIFKIILINISGKMFLYAMSTNKYIIKVNVY